MRKETEILDTTLDRLGFDAAKRDRISLLMAEADWTRWFETIDDSPYALTDWLNAFAFFDDWLSDQEISARPIEAMLGYLECCTLTLAETLSLPEFTDLVRGNLEQYGFDAAQTATPSA